MNITNRTNPKTTVSIIEGLTPRVAIKSEALNKMYLFIKECNEEVGWLGTIEQIENSQYFIINDVFLFEQNVSAVTTEITPEGLSTFAEEIMQRPDGMEVWNSMKVWGHSHVNMGITPSGQDDKQMRDFQSGGHDYFIRLIGNKKGEMKLDFYNFKLGITYLDIPWERLESDEEVAISDEIFRLQQLLNQSISGSAEQLTAPIQAELKAKVKKIASSYQRPINSYPNYTGATVGGQSNVGKTYPMTNGGQNINEVSTTKKKLEQREEMLAGHVGEDDETIIFSTDHFYNDDAVVQAFSILELQAFSRERTFEDLEDLLAEYGYLEHFTVNDIERIYRVAFKYSPLNYGSEK